MKAIIYLLLTAILFLVGIQVFGQTPPNIGEQQLQPHHQFQPITTTATTTGAGNLMDYGLIGVLAIGVLGLLAFTVKSDRGDRHRLVDAINNLSTTNANLAHEIRDGHRDTHGRIDALQKDIKSLQEEVGKSAKK